MSTTRDRREDRHHIAVSEPDLAQRKVGDGLVIHERLHVPTKPTLVIQDPVREAREPHIELSNSVREVRRYELNRLRTPRVLSKGVGEEYLNPGSRLAAPSQIVWYLPVDQGLRAVRSISTLFKILRGSPKVGGGCLPAMGRLKAFLGGGWPRRRGRCGPTTFARDAVTHLIVARRPLRRKEAEELVHEAAGQEGRDPRWVVRRGHLH